MAVQTKPEATRSGPRWGERSWAGAEGLAERYRGIRDFTTRLCEPLGVEDYVAQSMTDASPAKWHIAHTTWFFETFVLPADRSYRAFHPAYGYLFNSYYNAVGDRVARPIRGLMTRPPVEEVLRYRRHVDDAVEALLERIEPPEADRVRALVEIGLQHEQQHQELLLTDLKHLFSLNRLQPAYRPAVPSPETRDPGPMRWRSFEEGVRWIGHEGDGFAYDNESPRHRVFLDAFAIADRLVTNREYLAFMADGGYERSELWLDEGWATARARGWRAPLYWHETDEGGRELFTLAGRRALAPDEPVCHVSFYEADAFARWAGARLPSEAEWETAARESPDGGNFAEGARYHPAAAGPAGDGLRQMLGDVWEWTRSPYGPYPGYEAVPGPLGEYNGKFMCNQVVLRGGSCATPAGHIRRTYRNFFYPPARWQFSGIRLARDVR